MEHTTPPTESDNIDTVRLWGALAMGAGILLSVAALVFEGGKPPWQVLAVGAIVTIAGMALRIEAAIRLHGLR